MRHQRKRISLLFLFALVCIAFILASSHQKRHLRSSLNLTLYDEMNCGCPRPGPVLTFPDNASLCSDWSTARGNGQKVVAYAIYGNHSNRGVFRHYYSQLENRIKEVKFYYEGQKISVFYFLIWKFYHFFLLFESNVLKLNYSVLERNTNRIYF